MQEDEETLRQRVSELEKQLGVLQTQRRGVRKRSDIFLFGLPLYDIALGPDLEKGETRGHARGIIALGDIASGVLAVGGVARGGLAVGGAAVGLIAVGGAAVGMLAMGGAAIGMAAIGGSALGYYACGGAGAGKYVLAAGRSDPEAVAFFKQFAPGLLP